MAVVGKEMPLTILDDATLESAIQALTKVNNVVFSKLLLGRDC